MKRVITYLSFILSVVLATQLNATHIVGGEIYYDNLGGNNYKITLKVYRDCFNGQAQLDNPAEIRIFDKNGLLVDTMQLPMLSLTNIAPTINNPCITPPGNECVEEGVYVGTINLAPKSGGYYVVYQRCCRNNSILNIVTPGATGVTYWEHIPGPEVVAVNSSPRFNKFPPIYLCNGVQIKFDHAATDPDGDVLKYSLCSPYDGCSPPPSGPCPIMPPPYNPVQFIPGHSGSYPMSSNPATAINQNTGFLTGTPDTDGQWVVGVCVEEWRGSTLIATHYRDFQFNVVTCQVSVLAQFNDQSTPLTINNVSVANQYCSGYTLHFKNNSIGGTSFTWNFGDPNTLADTSHLVNTLYSYPDTGAYIVSLIANPGKPCADTIKKTFYVYPELKPTLNAPSPQCVKNNSFTFTPGGMFAPSYTTFNWNFGAFATPVTSTAQIPSGVVYSASGLHPVQVLVQQKMCKKTLYDTVEVYPVPTANFVADSVILCDPAVVTFTNNSTAGGVPSYLWQFSDGGSSTAVSPTHVFSPAGVYNVTLTIKATAGCVDTSVFVVPGMVTVNPKPIAGFSLTPSETTVFDPDISFFNNSTGATGQTYYFDDGSVSTDTDPIHTYQTYGEYNVTQIVENQFGCKDTAIGIVIVKPEFAFWIPNSFTPGNKDGMNDIFKPSLFGVEKYLFEIYDRWGERIFITKDTSVGWDGSRGGKPCQQDVYVWMITFYNVVTKREQVHYGHVNLLK